MEFRVDFLGTDVVLNLFLNGICSLKMVFVQGLNFHTEGKAYLYKHFLDSIHFLQKHNMHTLFVFSIAKGLATCQLVGVISA